MASQTQAHAGGEPVVPAGFEPLNRTSPFLDRLGTFYYRDSDEGTVYGVRVEAHHANGRGVALGHRTAFASRPTIAARHLKHVGGLCRNRTIGDWIDVRVDIQAGSGDPGCET